MRHAVKCQLLRGEALSGDHWVELAEASLQLAKTLPGEDVLAVLHAMDGQADDPSVTSALAERLSQLAPQLAVAEALQGWQLLRRQPKKRTLEAALVALELRLEDLNDGSELRETLRVLVKAGGGQGIQLMRRLAAMAGEFRLSYGDLLEVERHLELLGGLQEPLDELLRQRKLLFLKEAPLASLLRALRAAYDQMLLDTFVERLETESASHFEDPFQCLELLVRHQRLPSSFLSSLATWTRRNLRRSQVTARRLVALDDALAQRGIARDDLDAAIRSFIAWKKGVSAPETLVDQPGKPGNSLELDPLSSSRGRFRALQRQRGACC